MKATYLAIALSLATITLARTAKAEPGINYNFAEADFVYVEPDSSDLGSSLGAQTLLSWSPTEYFFLEGGYRYTNVGVKGPGDIDLSSFKYGGGGYYPLSPDLHLVGRVGGVSDNAHFNGDGTESVATDNLSQNDNGVYTGVALRYAATKELELEPAIDYEHLSGGSSAWLYSVKGLYALDDNWQLTGSGGISDETDVEVTAGVRYNWGCAGQK